MISKSMSEAPEAHKLLIMKVKSVSTALYIKIPHQLLINPNYRYHNAVAMPLDPLTALSLAGTICQFVDFSCKVLSATRHVYNSYDGDLTVNRELGLITNEIQDLTAKLTRPMPSTGPLSPDEQKLKDLCVACNKVAAELIEKLNSLKARGQHQAWQSLQVAVQSAWSRQDLNDLIRRLTMFKEAIESRIVLGLRFVDLKQLFLEANPVVGAK